MHNSKEPMHENIILLPTNFNYYVVYMWSKSRRTAGESNAWGTLGAPAQIYLAFSKLSRRQSLLEICTKRVKTGCLNFFSWTTVNHVFSYLTAGQELARQI